MNASTDKNIGFFNGSAELVEMLIKYGEDTEKKSMQAVQRIEDIGGQKYRWDSDADRWIPIEPTKLIPDDDPVAASLEFFTLDGIVDYIIENVEGLVPIEKQNRLILHVVDQSTVELLSHPSERHKKRNVIARCKAHVPGIIYNAHMDAERFNTQLLSNFIETPARAELFKVIKSLTKEQGCNTTDDGVSQVITVKQGVSMAQNVTFQNPVPLKPMRTFPEIEQPESNFTLRINENAQCALFEADGGVWKNVAVAGIRDYLKVKLKDANVVVIA